MDSCSGKKKKTKTESPPRLTELDLLYLHEETLDCSFCPLKEKKHQTYQKLLEVALSHAIWLLVFH